MHQFLKAYKGMKVNKQVRLNIEILWDIILVLSENERQCHNARGKCLSNRNLNNIAIILTPNKYMSHSTITYPVKMEYGWNWRLKHFYIGVKVQTISKAKHVVLNSHINKQKFTIFNVFWKENILRIVICLSFWKNWGCTIICFKDFLTFIKILCTYFESSLATFFYQVLPCMYIYKASI